VIRIWSKQQEHCTVHNLNNKQSPGDNYSGKPKTARSQENIVAIKTVIDGGSVKPADDPTSSSCRRNVLGINPTTWHRIATKDLKYHSYKLAKSHGLKPEDYPRRVGFANHILTLSNRKLANIAYSDEATFSLDGEVNTQNVRRYAAQKVYGQPVVGKTPQFRHTQGLKSSFASWERIAKAKPSC
jgi:hypothetical protein